MAMRSEADGTGVAAHNRADVERIRRRVAEACQQPQVAPSASVKARWDKVVAAINASVDRAVVGKE